MKKTLAIIVLLLFLFKLPSADCVHPVGDRHDLLLRAAQVFMADPQHFLPGQIVPADGIAVSAMISFQRAGNGLTYLFYRYHGGAALGPHGDALHGADVFHQEYPHGLAARLCAENVRQLQNGHIEVWPRIV